MGLPGTNVLQQSGRKRDIELHPENGSRWQSDNTEAMNPITRAPDPVTRLPDASDAGFEIMQEEEECRPLTTLILTTTPWTAVAAGGARRPPGASRPVWASCLQPASLRPRSAHNHSVKMCRNSAADFFWRCRTCAHLRIGCLCPPCALPCGRACWTSNAHCLGGEDWVAAPEHPLPTICIQSFFQPWLGKTGSDRNKVCRSWVPAVRKM
ncbi:uncharacterized protein [Kogia breviceps]|uniref:uncharacterized protein isoform X2 n=1 Tax=Kogia breviceps TaxID=27615 RepID=UPI0034D1EC1B